MTKRSVEFLRFAAQEPEDRGTPGRIRTCDLRISIPLQLSLPLTAVRICGLDFIFIPEALGM